MDDSIFFDNQPSIDINSCSVSEANQYFQGLDIDTLPIKYGEKAPPLIKYWQVLDTSQIWQKAPPNFNLAIRCGGTRKIAVIDCDEYKGRGALEILINYFDLSRSESSFPIVQSASGNGAHIYLRLTELPPFNAIDLDPEIGFAQLRCGPGAYVIAPPSIVGKGKYILTEGNLNLIPEVDLLELEPFLKKTSALEKKLSVSPSASNKKSPSRDTQQMMAGKIPTKFHGDRSRAEQSLITSLINQGYNRDEILDIFLNNPCAGKFLERYKKDPKAGIDYFDKSYENAYDYAVNNKSKGRLMAERAKEYAYSHPWPGITGIRDKAVFLALAEIAYNCGKEEFAASCRCVAELSNFSPITVSKSIRKLDDLGLIEVVRPGKGSLATVYRFKKGTLPHKLEIMRECIDTPNHDAFSHGGLRVTSRHILNELLDHPSSIADLVRHTGITRQTIKKWLMEMSSINDDDTGEFISLVYEKEGLWHIDEQGDFDEKLDRIAAIKGVSGAIDKKKEKHIDDRQRYKKSLEKGSKGKHN